MVKLFSLIFSLLSPLLLFGQSPQIGDKLIGLETHPDPPGQVEGVRHQIIEGQIYTVLDYILFPNGNIDLVFEGGRLASHGLHFGKVQAIENNETEIIYRGQAGSFTETLTSRRYFIGRGTDPTGGNIAVGVSVLFDTTVKFQSFTDTTNMANFGNYIIDLHNTKAGGFVIAGVLAQAETIHSTEQPGFWYKLREVILRTPSDTSPTELGQTIFSNGNTENISINTQVEAQFVYDSLSGTVHNVVVPIQMDLTSSWNYE